MRLDDDFSAEEIRLIQTLKGKNRMEQDQILFEYEKEYKNGNII